MSAPVLEWQIAEGSRTAHVIDAAGPAWRNPDGSRRASGPRALCGKYPQRRNGPWFGLSANPAKANALATIRGYMCTPCEDCAAQLAQAVNA